jgi:hypothetical protein
MNMEHVFKEEGIRGILHQPEHATGDAIALTHGAGSNFEAPLPVRLARTLGK